MKEGMKRAACDARTTLHKYSCFPWVIWAAQAYKKVWSSNKIPFALGMGAVRREMSVQEVDP